MGRAPCCDRDGLKKGPWTPEEDQKLVDYIHNHGSGNWRTLPKNAGLRRCGKSCRLRWTNYLRPDIKRGKFSIQEEEAIIHLHSILGNKWSAIASRLPGRTDNEIKNYWNTHIRKRLLRMGIDPVTHSPRLDLLDLSSILNQSLYNHQFANPDTQFRVARLLGLQHVPMVNPEILKLANSIFSRPTQPDPNTNLTMLNQTPTDPEIQHQVQFNTAQEQFVQTPHLPNLTTSTPNHCMPMSQGLNQLEAYDNLMDVGFNDETQVFCAAASFDVINQHDYVSCYTDQSLISSMFSGPSSSSTPLHSNSNSNSNSTYITTEEERESYCSNLIKFELPADFLDVSEYL